MPAALELGGQPVAGDHLGQLGADHAGPHREDVAVVVALAQLGAVDVAAGADADALHLAGGDADADAGAADQDAAVALAGGNGLRGTVTEDGIVIIPVCGVVIAEILPFETHFIEHFGELTLQGNPGMVTGQSDHRHYLPFLL